MRYKHFTNYKVDSWKWRSLEKDKINFVQAVCSLPKDAKIHIGADSQRLVLDYVDLVCCFCVHFNFGGGRVYYAKHKNVKASNLWEKLYNETIASLIVATEIVKLRNDLEQNIVVHIDANPNKKYASSDYVKTLAGMIMGHGFKHCLKPNAWASSSIADHIVRKGIDRKRKKKLSGGIKT